MVVLSRSWQEKRSPAQWVFIGVEVPDTTTDNTPSQRTPPGPIRSWNRLGGGDIAGSGRWVAAVKKFEDRVAGVVDDLVGGTSKLTGAVPAITAATVMSASISGRVGSPARVGESSASPAWSSWLRARISATACR